jgi:PPIC-type PPIASE domain
VLPVELPSPPPLDTAPTPATTSIIPPAGATDPPPAGLPSMEPVESVANAPGVVNVAPPAVLPDLATITAQAKPVSPAPKPESSPAPAPVPGQVVSQSLVDEQVKQTNNEQLKRTSDDEAALQIKEARLKKKEDYLTFSAASVGDEIITINELEDAVKLQLAEYPDVRNMEPNSPQFREMMNQLAAITLSHLIDQRLILQEAKWKMKDKKKSEDLFNDFIDNLWKTDELPVLYRENGVTNVHELKIKMREKGQNYDTKKESFRKKEMAKNFLSGEIRNKVTHDMVELKAYYEAHRNDFIKPSRLTWREIEIDVNRYPDRATARKKADELLARLLHNENFEVVARSSSNGPTASQGGIYVDMTPGSYGIAAVNEELNRLSIGQVSQVIEARNSFHIIRVDSRREKGPLRFDEVQEQINEQVLMQNYSKAVNEYLAKLRAKTLIRTMFESTQEGLVEARPVIPQKPLTQANVPSKVTKNDPAVQPTANSVRE